MRSRIPTAMTASLFLRRGSIAGYPKTDHLSVHGPTGVGPTGAYAVTLTENVFRGVWCHDCKADECRHIAVVHRARAEGRLPPLDRWRPTDWIERGARSHPESFIAPS